MILDQLINLMTLSHDLGGNPPPHTHFFFWWLLVAPCCSAALLLCHSAALLLCWGPTELNPSSFPGSRGGGRGWLIFSQWCLADNSLKLNWCSASSAKNCVQKKKKFLGLIQSFLTVMKRMSIYFIILENASIDRFAVNWNYYAVRQRLPPECKPPFTLRPQLSQLVTPLWVVAGLNNSLQ